MTPDATKISTHDLVAELRGRADVKAIVADQNRHDDFHHVEVTAVDDWQEMCTIGRIDGTGPVVVLVVSIDSSR